MMLLQTVRDFFLDPVSGYVPIDETVTPIPVYMIAGTEQPTAQLQHQLTIADVTNIPTPMNLLWKRPATRLVR